MTRGNQGAHDRIVIGYDELAQAMASSARDEDEQAAYFASRGIDFEALGKTAGLLATESALRLDIAEIGGTIDRADLGAALLNAYLTGAEVALRAVGEAKEEVGD